MLNDGDSDIDLTSPSVNTPTVNPTTFDPECLSSEHVAVPRILFSPCSALVQLFNRIDQEGCSTSKLSRHWVNMLLLDVVAMFDNVLHDLYIIYFIECMVLTSWTTL